MRKYSSHFNPPLFYRRWETAGESLEAVLLSELNAISAGVPRQPTQKGFSLLELGLPLYSMKQETFRELTECTAIFKITIPLLAALNILGKSPQAQPIAASIPFSEGWGVHLITERGDLGTGRRAIIFVTKNGKLNDTPQGAAAYRKYELRGDGSRETSWAVILEEGYFSGGRPWSPDPSRAAFTAVIGGMARCLYLINGKPGRVGGGPHCENFSLPEEWEDMEELRKAKKTDVVWFNKYWRIDKREGGALPKATGGICKNTGGARRAIGD